MKFKDRLKALRTERGLTQKELGEKIFVTRSAIAKWENGLGLPSAASYEALLSFFEVEREAFPLNEEEEKEEIKKNLRIHIIKEIVGWILILALGASPFLLLWAIDNGYGFTSEMAAGKVFADNERIETEDYDFYLFSPLVILDENGEVESEIPTLGRIIKKNFYGYQLYDRDKHPECTREVISPEGKKIGLLYSFEGDDCYYHFYKTIIYFFADFEKEELTRSEQYILNEVYVNGERVELRDHVYFVTEENIDSFFTQDMEVTLKPYSKNK